jgi:coproporphyrinogen III oxidase-like Fe-S oxidoreductase
VRGVRSKNLSNTRGYCDLLARGELPVESREDLPHLARAGETAAFGLRMPLGWRFDEFRRITGHDLQEAWAAEMQVLADRGWASLSAERFHLNRTGLRFADSAAELFLK